MSEPLTELYLFAGAALFALGLYGLIASAHPLRKIITLNVMATIALPPCRRRLRTGPPPWIQCA